MNFSNWIIGKELKTELTPFFENIKRQALASIRPIREGEVLVSLPSFSKTIASIPQFSQQPTEPVYSLAAHTDYGSDLIEGIGHGDPYGKGTEAYKKIQGKLTSQQWDQKQVEAFKKSLHKNIKNISSHLGLLFETEVFSYLVDQHGLEEIGEKSSFNVYSERDQYIQKIKNIVGERVGNQLIQMTQIHAEDLASQILIKTNKLLNCKVTQIEFKGGMSINVRDTSDVILKCGSSRKPRNQLGYSLKFTSETKVGVASMPPAVMYDLLGGKHPDSFANNLNNTEDPKEATELMLNTLTEIAERTLTPTRFTNIMNNILSGEGDVLPAIRNYVSGSGTVSFSKSIQKDFITSEEGGQKIKPRPGATVEVKRTTTYVSLIYKVPGGTTYGTQIFLEPRDVNRINIKMTNIGSNKW